MYGARPKAWLRHSLGSTFGLGRKAEGPGMEIQTEKQMRNGMGTGCTCFQVIEGILGTPTPPLPPLQKKKHESHITIT